MSAAGATMIPGMKARAAARTLAVALLCAGAAIAHPGAAQANSPNALRATYGALQDRLSDNQFRRPLYLDSSETPEAVAGDIYALVSYPFATVGAALNAPGIWCDILPLHLNIKNGRPSIAGKEDILNVSIGGKNEQPLDEAHHMLFAYRVTARTPNYLRVTLSANVGPLRTRDFRIVLEPVALDDGQTFIHLSYSFAYGLVGRLAMQAYLGTSGRDKVGFTVAGTQPDGQPLHIGGMRGVVERNTMRYYLAIEAFLGALTQPPQAQFEGRLHDWFAASERYPRQLHEMEQGAYLDMKRKEYRRQQAELAEVGARRLRAATP
jgi:hypothetical protein